jgi:hypothetical protein
MAVTPIQDCRPGGARIAYPRGVKLAATASLALLAACGSSDPDAPTTDAAPDGPGVVACRDTVWEAPAACAATDVAGKLACIPGMTAVPRPDLPLTGYTRYDLTYQQPIDHAYPLLGSFSQHAILMVRGVDRPFVMQTSGYNLSARSRVSEPSALFGANELRYEHRFFEASIPAAPADWSKLDIRQAAGDAHRLAAALHWIFPGKWLNTGASKGGMTSVFQRRFYPCDVDATIAYVAPASVGLSDPQYNVFLADVGGAAYASCRAEVRAFQRRLLEQRAELLPLIGGTFTQIPIAKAYEMAVEELAFTLWQYTNPDDPTRGCAAIPPATATPTEMVTFLNFHAGPATIAGDSSVTLFRPYYHQSAAQLGYPSPVEVGLADLLLYPGSDVPEVYLPPGTTPAFDASAMPDIRSWVTALGARIMFIYGEYDPWSARMFEPTAANDSMRYVDVAGNHGAVIGSLEPADRAAAIAKLASWLATPPLAQAMQMRLPDDTALDRLPL